MQPEAEGSFDVTTASGEGCGFVEVFSGGSAARNLWYGVARLGFLIAVLAGMVVFTAVKHRHGAAVLKSPVMRPA